MGLILGSARWICYPIPPDGMASSADRRGERMNSDDPRYDYPEEGLFDAEWARLDAAEDYEDLNDDDA